MLSKWALLPVTINKLKKKKNKKINYFYENIEVTSTLEFWKKTRLKLFILRIYNKEFSLEFKMFRGLFLESFSSFVDEVSWKTDNKTPKNVPEKDSKRRALWWDFLIKNVLSGYWWGNPKFKKRDIINYLFYSKTDVSEAYSLLLQGSERSVKWLNSLISPSPKSTTILLKMCLGETSLSKNATIKISNLWKKYHFLFSYSKAHLIYS